MYVHALSQEHFVGVPIMRRKESNFTPEVGGKLHASLVWLHYEARERGRERDIRHKYSEDGEKYVYTDPESRVHDWSTVRENIVQRLWDLQYFTPLRLPHHLRLRNDPNH